MDGMGQKWKGKGNRMGVIYAVGIGPGDEKYMTREAEDAIAASDIVIGYKTYIELIRDRYPEKEYYVNGMRQETERCRKALELAAGGKTCAMISSGDAGVYGMASLLYELLPEYPGVELRMVPGITAALSGAAVLGSPIGHDFAVISLSDLLTPAEKIEKRLALAGEADLCICLYNPGSHTRKDYLKRACGILLQTRPADTVCGWVRNIGRKGQEWQILTLKELAGVEADMLMTVFIGNSETKVIGGHMVTPRGYHIEGNRTVRRNK